MIFKLLEEKKASTNERFTLLKFLPASENVNMSEVSYLDMKGFSGTVYKYRESGELKAVEGYQNGELQSMLTEATDQKQRDTKGARLQPEPCHECDEGGGGGSYVWVNVDSFVDYYSVSSTGAVRYMYSEQTGHRREPVYVPSNAPTPSSPQHSHTPHGSSGGGSSSGSSPHPKDIPVNNSFSPNASKLEVSIKPREEFGDKCTGLQSAWNLSRTQNKEVAGFITTGGGLVTTNVGTYTSSKVIGLYEHYNGSTYTSYYQYPVSQGAPKIVHPGMFVKGGRYYIPVVATFHTHIPCEDDGTNGVSHTVSPGDNDLARRYPHTKHYAIGCGAVAQFNTGSKFINVQGGSLSSLCKNVK